jgi:hypothetical protein
MMLSVVSKNILLGVKEVGLLTAREGLVPTGVLESHRLLKTVTEVETSPRNRQVVG